LRVPLHSVMMGSDIGAEASQHAEACEISLSPCEV